MTLPAVDTVGPAAVATGLARAPARGQLSLRVCLGWGTGTIGVAILFNTVNLLLLRFLTDFLGIAAAVGGLVLAASKIYDAVTDPLMGVITDRTRSRFGRRRPYLLLGGLLAAASLPVLFFLPTIVPVDARFATVVFAAFFYATAYTIFNVPYLAMASDMPITYHERSRLMSFRVSAIGIGQLLAGVLAPLLVVWFGGGQSGFAGMSLVMGALVGAACWASFFATRTAGTQTARAAGPHPARLRFRMVLENRPFALLLATKTLQLSGFAVLTSTLAFFVLQVLEAGAGTLATIFTVMTVVLVGSMPFWLAVSRRVGKVRTFQIGAVLFCVGSATWLFAGPGYPVPLILTQAALTGFASSGMLLVGQAMLPDTIAWGRHTSGENREGAFTGFYSSVEKIAFALGLAFTGLILGSAGYIEGQGDAIGVQPDSAIRAVYACIGVVPGLLALAAAAVLRFYRLDERTMNQMEQGHAC